ncbi:prepilin-type N-terminal cleavage/methylation domain-containing protein [Stieleria varia]|uniref:Type II secretion system protein H n=1 Tax=Stieleria varia TaxID=2528005 RepID=A0A5C6AGG6_9BACT|nr:prepilin-type N-terminal cleavage/methylation domain-containing protein [Stieleria varia]TWT98398.1 hypothetical protein Pla52n_49110 [Stieleria varia]
MTKTRDGRIRGFTLIELIVVLVIIAMLSGLVVLSVGSTMDRHRLSQAVETIEAFDMRLRREARAWRQPISAKVNTQSKTMVVPQADGSERLFQLHQRVDVLSWRLATRRSGGRQVEIAVDGDGRSSSYVVELGGGKSRVWLVVLGGSGQTFVTPRQDEARGLLTLLESEK